MKDFVAIDFETANNERSSVCSVGIVIVRDGKIVDKFYSLIKPEPEYFNYWCSQVHGLRPEDTEDVPIFPDVWKQIEPRIAFPAHNKFRRKLPESRIRCYQMDYPDYEFLCTCIAFAKYGPKAPQPRHHRRTLWT